MDEASGAWMSYVDAEVRAACDEKGWGSQIRRDWSVRDRPVSESSVEDYEWKLIPDADVRLPEVEPGAMDEGTYYLLRLDRRGRKLVLQHDTCHAGVHGPHFFTESYTEIHLAGLGDFDYMRTLAGLSHSEPLDCVPVPPKEGQLQAYLVDLTSRFGPNHFSIT